MAETAEAWGGVFAPLTTPFSEDGRPDLDGLRRNVQGYGAAPLAGYVVLGTNGEFPHLDAAERAEVVAAVLEASGDRPVLVQVGGASRGEALELARRAAALGARAALLVTPYYYRRQMTDATLAGFFADFAAECPLPLLVYNIPQNTGINVSPALAAQLAENPRIVGMKDSSGNLAQLAECAARTPPGWGLLNGSGSLLTAACSAGVPGAVLALADVLPFEVCEIWALCRQGRWTEALAAEARLRPVFRQLSRLGVAGTKLGMDLLGYRGGDPRPPLLPVPPADRDLLVDELRTAGLVRF